MRLDLLLPAIAALLGSLTGLDARDGGMPAGFTDPVLKAKLEYRVTAINGIGDDEWRYGDPGDGLEHLTICGTRKFTVSVRCESYDQSSNLSAQWYLERIYTRLSRPSALDALRAVDCCWIDSHSYVDLPTPKDDRVWSIGVKDFVFTAAVNDSADDSAADSPITTIDTVQFVSQYLFQPDGVTQTRDQIDVTVTL